MRVREPLKALLELALVGSGVAAMARRRMRDRALVLAFHNVVPRGAAAAGERSLHVPLQRFTEYLDVLTATHDVVPLAAALAPAGTGRPRVALTFDDAYRGAVTVGAAELARRGLPATFFVTPAFVGGGTFWWDALAGPTGAVDDGFRTRALTELRGEDARVRAAAALPPAPLPPHAAVASVEELRAALRAPGISLASHSWSHANLAALEGAALVEELTKPQRWLAERFETVSPYLAYPYGSSSPAVERAAAAAGYEAAFRISGGWLPEAGARFALPRINVPAGLSAAGLALRGAGLLTR